MYDYMKALQRQFETKPRSIQELADEVDRTHRELSSRLAKEDRKLLLRLVDLEDNLQSVATLHSFVCGYRLACGKRCGSATHWYRTAPQLPQIRNLMRLPSRPFRLKVTSASLCQPTRISLPPQNRH